MYQKSDKNSIKNLFNNIYQTYDIANNIMSFGFHLAIKKKAVTNLEKYIKSSNYKKEGLKIADLCTGTGDIAFLLSQKFEGAEITGFDFSENMLKIAKEKYKNVTTISFENKDIMELDDYKGKFDICFISFGLRNTANISESIRKIKSILKQGGIICILDLGHPVFPLNLVYFIYLNHIIPLIDKFIKDKNSPYKYLSNSIKDYPDQKSLIRILEQEGFKNSENKNLLFGIFGEQIATL